MPKTVELTIEIEVEKVSCPGVWLCQDGRVSLTVYALETSYQTCLLPPTFPLAFKDVFYFRKRFKEACAVNNICCLLKDETIYCELVQWSEDCASGECVLLAQYMGSLSEVLFTPNTCSSDGVDLLMRRTKEFPGILSPKIEIATKVRIDEIRGSKVFADSISKEAKKGDHSNKTNVVDCDTSRHRPVCHSPHYHRIKCKKTKRTSSRPRSRISKSHCSIQSSESSRPERPKSCVRPACPSARPRCDFAVFTATTATDVDPLLSATNKPDDSDSSSCECESEGEDLHKQFQKVQIASRYIVNEDKEDVPRRVHHWKVTPCVCEICKKYHELFHIRMDS